jgi:hypothetical protein
MSDKGTEGKPWDALKRAPPRHHPYILLVRVRAASRVVVSPSGLARASWGPTVMAGVVRVSVFASTSVTAAFFPAMVAVVPVWKLLPPMVMVVPPTAGEFAGEIVPTASGVLAS